MFSTLSQNLSVNGNGYDLPGDEFPAVLQSGFRSIFQSAAAGNLHTQDRKAADLIFCNDFCELFCVVYAVELRASDQRDPSPHEISVEICIGVSGTIRGDQKIRILEIGSGNRNQFDLAGPLIQL